MSRMSNIILGVIAAGAAGLCAAYLCYHKGIAGGLKFPKTVPATCITNKKTVEGSASFNDMVSWFKSIYNLDKTKHTPFIADAVKFADMFNYTPTGKKALLLGVYEEESDKIVNHLLIEMDSFDAKTTEVLGNDPLVVLS